MRIGFGYDVHQLVKDRKLIIGGVEIPYQKGLLGHSDADVLVHSIMDAILGALGEGDIGKHFPDTSMEYKDIDSFELLAIVYNLMKAKGYRIENIDNTIAMQEPKLSPYIEKMREKLSKALELEIECINIKATTTEKLGFEGRGEGASAYSVCLLSSQKIK